MADAGLQEVATTCEKHDNSVSMMVIRYVKDLTVFQEPLSQERVLIAAYLVPATNPPGWLLPPVAPSSEASLARLLHPTPALAWHRMSPRC